MDLSKKINNKESNSCTKVAKWMQYKWSIKMQNNLSTSEWALYSQPQPLSNKMGSSTNLIRLWLESNERFGCVQCTFKLIRSSKPSPPKINEMWDNVNSKLYRTTFHSSCIFRYTWIFYKRWTYSHCFRILDI